MGMFLTDFLIAGLGARVYGQARDPECLGSPRIKIVQNRKSTMTKQVKAKEPPIACSLSDSRKTLTCSSNLASTSPHTTTHSSSSAFYVLSSLSSIAFTPSIVIFTAGSSTLGIPAYLLSFPLCVHASPSSPSCVQTVRSVAPERSTERCVQVVRSLVVEAGELFLDLEDLACLWRCLSGR